MDSTYRAAGSYLQKKERKAGGPARWRWMACMAAAAAVVLLAGCQTGDRKHRILISVADQRMLVLENGWLIAQYPVSTSKFCLSDVPGSKGTPLGELAIAKKIGANAPAGAVFHNQRQTGEILRPDAPGRDPIVSRILWLKGLEKQNANAYRRYIYIHGTAEEAKIGTPASYGCVRMRSADVIKLFNTVNVGAKVDIQEGELDASKVAAASQL